MNPNISEAIDRWMDASENLQNHTVDLLCLALPGLDHAATPPYCCPVTLHIDKPGGHGDGRVCIDTDTLVTVEIGQIPNAALAQAVDEVYGIGWFDEAEAALIEEGPGTYHYDDETTGAEWVVELGEDGQGKVLIDCVPAPYAAELLDAITSAVAEQKRQAEAQKGDGTLTA